MALITSFWCSTSSMILICLLLVIVCRFRDWIQVTYQLGSKQSSISLTPLQVFIHYYNGLSLFSLIQRVFYVKSLIFKFVDYLFILLRSSFEKSVLITLRKFFGELRLGRSESFCVLCHRLPPGGCCDVHLLSSGPRLLSPLRTCWFPWQLSV